MKFIIVASSIVVPLIMCVLQQNQPKIKTLYHIIAFIAVLVFGNIAALNIYQVIVDKAVFTMDIHGLFLNPIFLLSGSYIGIYLIYSLLIKCVNYSSEDSDA